MTSKFSCVVCAYHTVGYRCIEELLKLGAYISLIYTHEDSQGETIWFSSVRELAERHSIPFCTGDISLPENIARVRELAPDFIFSFYYRNMICKEVLEIPRLGALNLHGSYLPKYRGRVPVNWAIINGETESGATLHYMTAKPDAGDIVDQEKVAIEFSDSALDLFYKITDVAVQIISRSYPQLCNGTAARIPMNLQDGSYFGGRKPEDGKIDWQKSALSIYNLVRGVAKPYPGAYFMLNGEKVVVWKSLPMQGDGAPGEVISTNPLTVGTGDGQLQILEMEPVVELNSGICLQIASLC